MDRNEISTKLSSLDLNTLNKDLQMHCLTAT